MSCFFRLCWCFQTRAPPGSNEGRTFLCGSHAERLLTCTSYTYTRRLGNYFLLLVSRMHHTSSIERDSPNKVLVNPVRGREAGLVAAKRAQREGDALVRPAHIVRKQHFPLPGGPERVRNLDRSDMGDNMDGERAGNSRENRRRRKLLTPAYIPKRASTIPTPHVSTANGDHRVYGATSPTLPLDQSRRNFGEREPSLLQLLLLQAATSMLHEVLLRSTRWLKNLELAAHAHQRPRHEHLRDPIDKQPPTPENIKRRP